MKRLRLGLAYVLIILMSAGAGLLVLERQWIGDWLVLHDYTPPAAITGLADQTTMTAKARHLFYINHPSLEDKAGFNQDCTSRSENSVVLGCFRGNRMGIFVYDVQDARLDGVEQVTAAHEMLHQAYDRLTAAERQRIDGLLQSFAATGTFEPRLKQKLELYKQTEPDQLDNEMHSIFATEVRTLPAELETYYSQYFLSRGQVVTYSDRYQGEFAARTAKVDSYDAQLKDINTQIGANKSELETRQNELSTRKAAIQLLLTGGNQAAYQSAAVAYNAQVAAYNALIDSTQQLIAQYNTIVAERNQLSVEEQQLQQALDSRLQQTSP